MSRYLNIECEPLAQPAATDPLEKASWSSVRIRVGARTVSRVLDRKLPGERSLLYVPVFETAEWVVGNWWALLHETCRTEFLPRADADEPHFSWTRRHCLRTADSDVLLPALYLFSDGRGLRAEWRADDEDSLPHMPAFFVESGRAALDRQPTEQTLAAFVADVFSRVEPTGDERVREARETWNAIQSADAQERAFCIVAGRLGLDPYDQSEIPDSLAELIEKFADADDPLVADLTSAALSANLEQQWEWVERIRSKHHLGPSAPVIEPPADTGYVSAARYGYDLAREFRRRASLAIDAVLPSIESLAAKAIGKSLRRIDENHLVGRGVQLVAGRDSKGDPLLVGPVNPIDESERFRAARGLFQIAVAGRLGPRLVTDAFTWNQRASRAFAAELIAPQEGLKSRAGMWADREAIQELGRQYRASTVLIEKQLKNAQVPIAED